MDKKWKAEQMKLTWQTYDKGGEKPDWSKADESLFCELDKLNHRWLKDDGRWIFNIHSPTEEAEYWSDVLRLFKERGMHRHSVQKVKWYMGYASVDDRLAVPLLTPNMLDALAANIGARAKAYEEVSGIYTLYFIIIFCLRVWLMFGGGVYYIIEGLNT